MDEGNGRHNRRVEKRHITEQVSEVTGGENEEET